MNLKLQSKGKILVAEYLTFLLNLIPRLLLKLEHHLLKQRRWDDIKTKRLLGACFLFSKWINSNTSRWQWYLLGMVLLGLANWQERWIDSIKEKHLISQFWCLTNVETKSFQGSWNHGNPARNCEAADWGRHYKKDPSSALNFAKMEHKASFYVILSSFSGIDVYMFWDILFLDYEYFVCLKRWTLSVKILKVLNIFWPILLFI